MKDLKILNREEALVVEEALRRELALLEAKVGLLRREIDEFEVRKEMDSASFLERFESGELGDEQEFFEWWGLLKGLDKLQDRMAKIKAVLG